MLDKVQDLKNKLLKYGTFFLVFLLPVVYFTKMLYPYTTTKTFFFYGVVEILLSIWIYAILFDKSYRLSKKVFIYFIPFLLYIGWMTIAGFFALSPNLSFWSSLGRGTGLITLYHCFALAVVVASLVKKYQEEYLHRLMFWFINGGFVLMISIWLGSQGLNLLSSIKNDAGGGMIGNSSLAATYILFAILFNLFLLFSKKIIKKEKIWLSITLAVFVFSPLFLDIHNLFIGNGLLGSARGALLGIIAGIFITSMVYLLLSPKKIYRFVGIAVISISIVLFSVGWHQLVKPNTFLHQKFEQVATGGSRFIFWDIAKKSMNEHPWLGYGPENYMYAFQRNFNPEIALKKYSQEGWSDRAHNIYYDTGVSGGYPSIVFYCIFLCSVLYAIYSLARKNRLSRIQASIISGFFIGYIFQNLFVFDSVLSWIALVILTGILFSLTGDTEESSSNNNFKFKINKKIAAVVLCVACIFSLIAFVYRPAKKTMKLLYVFSLPLDLRQNHYKDLLVGSSAGDDWDVSEISYFMYKSFTADPISIKNNKQVNEYVVKDLVAYLQYLEGIMKKNKNDSRLYVSTAYLYNALNYFSDNHYDPILDKHLLELNDYAIKLSPFDPQGYWSLAQVYIWEGNYDKVVAAYKQAIDLNPTIPESYIFLMRFADNTKNRELYSDTLAEAQKNIPGFVL